MNPIRQIKTEYFVGNKPFSLRIVLIICCLSAALWTLSHIPILFAAPINQAAPTTPVASTQVSGQIQYPNGGPGVYSPFLVYNKDDDPCPNPDQVYPLLAIYSGTSNEMGHFLIDGLAEGTYCLLFPSIRGMSGVEVLAPQARPFSIEEGEEFVDLGTISFYLPPKQILGVVKDQSGEVSPNVLVSAELRRTIGPPFGAETRTDNTGQFTLTIPGGEWSIAVPLFTDVGVIFEGEVPSQTVQFANDLTEEVKTIEFAVSWPDGLIKGQFHLIDGSPAPSGSNTLVASVSSEEHSIQKAIRYTNSFTIPVFAGSYRMLLYPSLHSQIDGYLPTFEGIEVRANETVDLGEIRLLIKERAIIRGQITDTEDKGVFDLPISAWNGQGNRAMTRSDREGNYFLWVSPGPWQVGIGQSSTMDYLVEEDIKHVFVTEESIVDFTISAPDGKIIGTMIDVDGNILTDERAWAYAIPIELASKTSVIADSTQHGASVMLAQFEDVVENGRFEFNVPVGTYRVGLSLQPQSDYLVVERAEAIVERSRLVQQAQSRTDVAGYARAGEQIITIGGPQETNTSTNSAGDSEVAITLQRKDAYITGVLRNSDGTPAVGVSGEVRAMTEGVGGLSQYTSIDPSTAAYTLPVVGATWHLDYFLHRDTTYQPYSRQSLSVTLTQNETVIQDLIAVELDATLQGTLTDPDGTPVNAAYVWVHQRGEKELAAHTTGTDVVDGQFELNLATNLPYELNVSPLIQGNYIRPQRQLFTPTQGITSTFSLQLLPTNATISGTATAIYANLEQPAANAFIYAWSDEGQYLYTNADEMGAYQLDVVVGTVWHIGASWYSGVGPMFYKLPDEVVVDLLSASQTKINLALTAAPRPLPPATTALFKAEASWVETLADGMRIDIPAGAIPVDAPEDNVRLVITPHIEVIPSTFMARPIGYGYTIHAYNSTTNEEILGDLNEDLLLTFYYTDAEITELGMTEDQIMPAYFSAAQGRWIVEPRFMIDRERNQMTIQMNRFANWAIITPNRHAKPIVNHQLFLPKIGQGILADYAKVPLTDENP